VAQFEKRRGRMFPSEMVILMAITVARDSGNKLLTRPTDVVSEYIGYLYDSLVRRGYLKRNSLGGYQLTSKGRETLFEFLHQNKTRVRDTVNRLKQLGIEISQEQEQKIDKLGKEAMEVKYDAERRGDSSQKVKVSPRFYGLPQEEVARMVEEDTKFSEDDQKR